MLDTTSRSRGADSARSYPSTMPSKNRGRRESRVPMTPTVVRTTMHTADRRCAGTPGFPCAVVLTAYAAFSPEPNSSGLRRRRIGDCSKARSGPTISIGLTPATGARTAQFCRPRLPRTEALRPARMLPEEVLAEAFKRRSSARDVRSRKVPPCEPTARPNAAASTATRPNVRDAGQRPSWRDGIAGVVGLIWVPR
jgi:hypothetical protein